MHTAELATQSEAAHPTHRTLSGKKNVHAVEVYPHFSSLLYGNIVRAQQRLLQQNLTSGKKYWQNKLCDLSQRINPRMGISFLGTPFFLVPLPGGWRVSWAIVYSPDPGTRLLF